MNTMRSILDLSSNGRDVPINTFVVAAEPWIAQLEAGLTSDQKLAFKTRAMTADAPLPADVVGVAEMLVIEVDPAVPGSIERIAQLRDARPTMPLIAAIESADLKTVRSLMRQGVNDVVSLPFAFDDLFAEIMDASAAKAARGEVTLAPMVTVVGASGGVGTSSVLTQLASSIANHSACKRKCCIIDLDLQFGDVAVMFGRKPSTTVLDLLGAGARLDGDMLEDAAIDAGDGVFLLGAADQIAPIEDVDVEAMLRLVTLARERFGFVLLDLPANWTNWALSAALACSEIIVLTDPTINGLRKAKRCIELFDQVDVPPGQVKIAVNRSSGKLFQKISTQDIADTLRREVLVALPAEKNALTEAQDRGVLLSESNRRAGFVKAADTLADNLCSRLIGAKA